VRAELAVARHLVASGPLGASRPNRHPSHPTSLWSAGKLQDCRHLCIPPSGGGLTRVDHRGTRLSCRLCVPRFDSSGWHEGGSVPLRLRPAVGCSGEGRVRQRARSPIVVVGARPM
jgi:hypothetical protein